MKTDATKIYLDALFGDLSHRAQLDELLHPFIARMKTIDTTTVQRGPFAKLDHPSMVYLDQILAAASGNGHLVNAAVAAARKLDWSQVFAGGGIEPSLAEGMIAAQLAGNNGRFASEDLATGQFMLAPRISYPLHSHAATEIYYCISGTLHLQHGVDGAPFELTPGSYSITPSNRLHALETASEPVLLLYVWIGDLSAPNWWWSAEDDGSWRRTAWLRVPGEPWKPTRSEVVTAEIMAEAHG